MKRNKSIKKKYKVFSFEKKKDLFPKIERTYETNRVGRTEKNIGQFRGKKVIKVRRKVRE